MLLTFGVTSALLMVATGVPSEIPLGYEVVEIIPAEDWTRFPRINNCGEIVTVHEAADHPDHSEVYYCDNGRLSRVTFTDDGAWCCDINDLGVIVWAEGWNPNGYGGEWIMKLEDGETTVVGEGTKGARINNQGHMVWSRSNFQSCATESAIVYYDGSQAVELTSYELSNQSPAINNSDDVVWTEYTFCISPWESRILLNHDGETAALPTSSLYSQLPDINDTGRIIWKAGHDIEVWDGGSTWLFGENPADPHLNNRGDISYCNWDEPSYAWNMRLYVEAEGQIYDITQTEEWDGDNELNDDGEVVWTAMHDPFGTQVTALMYMRRIRNGDIDNDQDVDLDDFADLPGCLTGPLRHRSALPLPLLRPGSTTGT